MSEVIWSTSAPKMFVCRNSSNKAATERRFTPPPPPTQPNTEGKTKHIICCGARLPSHCPTSKKHIHSAQNIRRKSMKPQIPQKPRKILNNFDQHHHFVLGSPSETTFQNKNRKSHGHAKGSLKNCVQSERISYMNSKADTSRNKSASGQRESSKVT